MISLWQSPFFDPEQAFDDLAYAVQARPSDAERSKGRRALTLSRIPSEVHETEGAWHIQAELPGVDKKDVRINIDKDYLCISAEKKSSFDDKSAKRHVTERYYGKVERRFQLPDSADRDHVEAKFEDGVVKLVFKKKEADKPKMISLM